MKAVIYTRASLDATGKRESVARQEKACRGLADARGWDVVEVVSDNSISAYGEKDRPGWRRVLEMVERSEVDVVIAFHLDRMTRSMLDLEAFISRAKRSGVGVATATGDVDLTTDSGRMVARILAAVARAEVERKAERQRLANADRAGRGEAWTGGPRPFGFTADGLGIVEEEAEALRQAARDVINGTPLTHIARQMSTASRALRARLEDAEGRAGVSGGGAAVAALSGAESAEEAWEGMGLYTRRAVVAAVLDVRLNPAGPGRPVVCFSYLAVRAESARRRASTRATASRSTGRTSAARPSS